MEDSAGVALAVFNVSAAYKRQRTVMIISGANISMDNLLKVVHSYDKTKRLDHDTKEILIMAHKNKVNT